MRYIKYHFENGYCGCDEDDVIAFNDDITNDQIDSYLYDDLQEYASGFENVAEGYDYEEGWESAEDEEFYYENCDYSWEEITKEEYKEWLGEDEYEEEDPDENWDFDEEDED